MAAQWGSFLFNPPSSLVTSALLVCDWCCCLLTTNPRYTQTWFLGYKYRHPLRKSNQISLTGLVNNNHRYYLSSNKNKLKVTFNSNNHLLLDSAHRKLKRKQQQPVIPLR